MYGRQGEGGSTRGQGERGLSQGKDPLPRKHDANDQSSSSEHGNTGRECTLGIKSRISQARKRQYTLCGGERGSTWPCQKQYAKRGPRDQRKGCSQGHQCNNDARENHGRCKKGCGGNHDSPQRTCEWGARGSTRPFGQLGKGSSTQGYRHLF